MLILPVTLPSMLGLCISVWRAFCFLQLLCSGSSAGFSGEWHGLSCGFPRVSGQRLQPRDRRASSGAGPPRLLLWVLLFVGCDGVRGSTLGQHAFGLPLPKTPPLLTHWSRWFVPKGAGPEDGASSECLSLPLCCTCRSADQASALCPGWSHSCSGLVMPVLPAACVSLACPGPECGRGRGGLPCPVQGPGRWVTARSLPPASLALSRCLSALPSVCLSFSLCVCLSLCVFPSLGLCLAPSLPLHLCCLPVEMQGSFLVLGTLGFSKNDHKTIKYIQTGSSLPPT